MKTFQHFIYHEKFFIVFLSWKVLRRIFKFLETVIVQVSVEEKKSDIQFNLLPLVMKLKIKKYQELLKLEYWKKM